MPDYKRLVSYIYNYEKGIKRNNVGYARIEARNGQCKCTLHITAPSLNDKQLKVYLFKRKVDKVEGILLGTCQIKNGVGDYKTVTTANHIMNTPYSLDDMGGMILYLSEIKFFGTEWDDIPITLESVSSLDRKPEEDNFEDNIQVGAANIKDRLENGLNVSKKFAENIIINKLTAKDDSVVEGENANKVETEVKDEKVVKDETEVKDEKGIKNIDVVKLKKAPEDEKVVNDKKVVDDVKEVDNKNVVSDEKATKDNEVAKNEMAAEDQNVVRQNDIYQYNGLNQGVVRANNGLAVEQFFGERKQDTEGMLERAEYTSDEEFFRDRECGQVNKNYNRTECGNEDQENRDYINKERYATKIGVEDHPLAKRILESFPRMYPFEDNEVAWCVKIEPQNIGLFPMEAWVLGNNSFLLHGYYSYRHLIFAKIKNGNSFNYILGVPGIYHNREKFMAKMFGFENFKCVKRKELRTGEFGYWYIPITLN